MLASDCLIYADGVRSRGYGHLYRMKALYDRFCCGMNVLFLWHTCMQGEFYSEHCLPSIKTDEALLQKPKLLIIDSKAPLPEQILALMQTSKIVLVVDSVASWVTSEHLVVFPIFYFDPKVLGSQNPAINLIGGKEFVLLRSPETANHSRKILVTFGGSDPNELTQMVLSALSKRKMLHETTVLIGPGFSNPTYYLDEFQDAHFAVAPSTTSEFVSSAELVITALGTTVQEVEFYEKKCCLFLNYETDNRDVELIRKFSANPRRFMNCGFYRCADFGVLNKALDGLSSRVLAEKVRADKDWGHGWPSLLTKLGLER